MEWFKANWLDIVTLLLTLITIIVGYIYFIVEFKKSNREFKDTLIQSIADRVSSTTSTFRQQWLQEFRESISEYYSLINTLPLITSYQEDYLKALSKIDYDIILRLNISSSVDKSIEEEIFKIRNLYRHYFVLLQNSDIEICSEVVEKLNYTQFSERATEVHRMFLHKASIESYMEEHPVSEHEATKVISDYSNSIKSLANNIIAQIFLEIEKKKKDLLKLFRAYLKTEWERIKNEIEYGQKEFDFEAYFNKIKNM